MDEFLSHSDKATYLANVLSVAKSDGKDTREEARVFQAIAERIGAEQRHFMAAQRLLRKGRYSLGYVRSRPLRMANVQDMVMIALADGTLEDEESKPIEGFAAQLRLDQQEMDKLVNRARSELEEVLAAEEAPPSKQPFDSPGEAAGAPPPSVPQSEPEPPPVPEPEPEPEPEPPTADLEPQPEEEIEKKEPPEEIQGIMAEASAVEACIRAHDASEEPRSYCFGACSDTINPWGCRLAQMNWEIDEEWFELGNWRDDATFEFDRDAIREKLEENLAAASICPHLKKDYVEAAIKALPTVASIWGRWQHRESDIGIPGARSVSVNEYVHGVSVTAERIVRGVDPVGRREALKLIVRASRRSGTEQPVVELLDERQ